MPPLIFRVLLLAYPAHLRRDFGDEMTAAFADAWRERRGAAARMRLVVDLIADFLRTWPREWRTRFSPSSRSASSPPAPRGSRGRFAADLRAALRLFTRAPLFTAGAVATLAVGIGAAVAILSLADATVLHPLPIPAPDRVVEASYSWSPADVWDLARDQRTFSAIAGWSSSQGFAVSTNGGTVDVDGAGVTGGYFRLTGLSPVIGRLLGPDDDVKNAAPVAVIGERFWRRTFNGDRAILGRTIELNRRSAVVVGVVPAVFRGLSLDSSPEVYVPLAVLPAVGTGFVTRPGLLEKRGTVWIHVAGRLGDGVTVAQASGDVDRVYRTLHPPASTTDAAEKVVLDPIAARAVGIGTKADLDRLIAILMGATAITLLLTCATVANLLLVRAEGRRRELAVRAALGAGRGRLMRLLFVESLTIGLTGGLIGVLVARISVSLLGAYSLPGDITIGDLAIGVDTRLLGSAVALGVVTSLVFGLAPMWRASRVSVAPALRDGDRGNTKQPLRSALVAAQIAFAVLLVGGSLAFGRAMRHALAVDLGFDTTHDVIVTTNATLARYTRDQTLAYERRVSDALAGTPWIDSAGWTTVAPLHGSMSWDLAVDGYTPAPQEDMSIATNVVSSGYFAAMGMRIDSGRDFSPADTAGGADAAIVNESFARKYFADGNALGGRVDLKADPKDRRWAAIVGVVNDARRGLERGAVPMCYLPAVQNSWMLDFGGQLLVVRSSRPPSAALTDITSMLRRIDPAVPITKTQTMAEHLGATLMPQQLGLTLFALFGALAIVLASLGIYAVTAYAVAHRVREIGLRLALGATPAALLRLVAWQGLRPVAAGLVVGLVAFSLGSAAIDRFMFGGSATSAITLAVIAGSIGALAIGAMFVPVRRALSVDPAVALRLE